MGRDERVDQGSGKHRRRRTRPISCRTNFQIRPIRPCTTRRRRSEIWEALDGRIDAFVAAVGTGGTITGCGEVFKERNPNVKVIAVEPAGSPVLSGGDRVRTRFKESAPGSFRKVLNRSILDRVITVTDDEAYQTAKLLVEEGRAAGRHLLPEPMSLPLRRWRPRLGPGKNVVTILCDTGERYISIEKYFNI